LLQQPRSGRLLAPKSLESLDHGILAKVGVEGSNPFARSNVLKDLALGNVRGAKGRAEVS
jgi:hypothetical protein